MTGRVIAGRYNLQHPIGRGAMGVVWRARDQILDRDVAVKEVVISSLLGEEERRNAYKRTLREARTAARLSHRGLVAVYDVAEEDGRPWIVMELVPSRSLDQVLTVEGRLPSLRVARIGQQLLSALAAAHIAGVLHRDVKPSNVLIATDRTGTGWDERAVLTDFGIAQFEGDPRLTQTGMVMGSPGFTAPERIRGGDATPASDLWSLGATLFAAVEGRGPYEQRGGAITTMSAIINEDAPVAAHAGRLAPVIEALLRRDPSSRPTAPAAARMFAYVLPLLSAAEPEPPAAGPPADRGSRRPGRRPAPSRPRRRDRRPACPRPDPRVRAKPEPARELAAAAAPAAIAAPRRAAAVAATTPEDGASAIARPPPDDRPKAAAADDTGSGEAVGTTAPSQPGRPPAGLRRHRRRRRRQRNRCRPTRRRDDRSRSDRQPSRARGPRRAGRRRRRRARRESGRSAEAADDAKAAPQASDAAEATPTPTPARTEATTRTRRTDAAAEARRRSGRAGGRTPLDAAADGDADSPRSVAARAGRRGRVRRRCGIGGRGAAGARRRRGCRRAGAADAAVGAAERAAAGAGPARTTP